MEEVLQRPVATQRRDDRIIEKGSCNGYDIEVEYDFRYIYGPQYKATMDLDRSTGQALHGKEDDD